MASKNDIHCKFKDRFQTPWQGAAGNKGSARSRKWFTKIVHKMNSISGVQTN